MPTRPAAAVPPSTSRFAADAAAQVIAAVDLGSNRFHMVVGELRSGQLAIIDRLKETVQFERYAEHPSGFFHGASLRAMESLGRRKGYRLVGCDSTGTNAFFLRDDVDTPAVPTLSADAAYRPHRNWLVAASRKPSSLRSCGNAVRRGLSEGHCSRSGTL